MPSAGDMSCRRARALLALQLAAQLPWEQEAGLHDHLAACPACRGEGEALQTLDAELRTAGTLAPPGDLWRRVSAEMARQPVPEAPAPLWRRLLAMPTPLAATAVAAAVVLTVLARPSAAHLRPLSPEVGRAVVADADAAFYAQHYAVAAWPGPATDHMALGTTLVSAVSAQEAEEQP